jgi:hypothetical protein
VAREASAGTRCPLRSTASSIDFETWNPLFATMELFFSTRSEFFPSIQAALDGVGGRLEHPLRIELRPGGYARDVVVVIRQDDPHAFWADWESKQPSRFSARIRAAATVLKAAGLAGRYRITHDDGVMVIQPV